MDNKLFEIFSGKTEVPEIVTDRIEAALNKIQEQQPDFGRDKIAVSYTHLDVYKRQGTGKRKSDSRE